MPEAVTEASEPSLREWKERTTGLLVLVSAVASLPLLLSALALPAVTWSWGVAAYYLVAYALILAGLFLRRLPREVRGWFVLSAFFMVAVVSLARTGWQGNARLILLGASIFAFILGGRRSGLVAVGISLALYAGFAVLAHHGLLDGIFRPPAEPLAPRNWAYYGTAVLVVLFPPLLYLGRHQQLQAELTSRWRAAAERLGDEVERRRRVEAAFLEFTERERRRLGLELHDGLCQQIAGAKLVCTSLESRLGTGSDGLAERLGRLGEALDEALGQAHDLARGLGTEVPVDGLPDALASLAGRTEAMHDVQCSFEHEAGALPPQADTATQLLRISQEAVSNAVRHGAPSRIRLRLVTEGDTLVLGIEDDGSGIPADSPRGLGLGAMEHRAERIGAKLTLSSGPRGTRVRCVLPNRAPRPPVG